MKFIISFIKKLFNTLTIYADTLIFKPQVKDLENGKLYGIKKKITFIDQLGKPDLKLVSKTYGEIKDKKAAKRFGTIDIKEYSYWAWRSCAVANVLMILKTEKLFTGTLYDLIKKLLDKESYLKEDRWGNEDIGWKHQELANLLSSYGLKASSIKRISVFHILKLLVSKKYLIVSIKSLNQDKGTHMILLTGFTKLSSKTLLHYHDPMNLYEKGGKRKINIKKFSKIFLNKGIIVDK